MKLILESTDQLARLESGEPVRVWKGWTERGVEVVAFVRQIAVRHGRDAAAFDVEVKSMPPGRVVDVRMTL